MPGFILQQSIFYVFLRFVIGKKLCCQLYGNFDVSSPQLTTEYASKSA